MGTAAQPPGTTAPDEAQTPLPRRVGEVLLVALRLGLTSFGGPVAHLGYFRAEYVDKRRWLDEQQFADLIGLCQFLPGPASSELGIAVGMTRAGLLGGLAAWVGFTLPSALALMAFAAVVRNGTLLSAGWLHGLQIVAVAVVAQALWGMARTLAPDRARASLAIVATIVALAWSTAATQVVVIAAAAVVGRRFLPVPEVAQDARALARSGRRSAIAALALFAALLAGLPVLRLVVRSQPLALADSFYRAGALVFGGGHVVLPLLQAAVVTPGWVSPAHFVAGYGAAQAVPGPLFTFSAYLGAIEGPEPNGAIGAAIALFAIFLPGFLLVAGSLPLWDSLRTRPAIRSALAGVNAGVVGLLLAAFYTPVWTSAITAPADVAVALAAFGLLLFWRVPPWLVVLVTAGAGAALGPR